MAGNIQKQANAAPQAISFCEGCPLKGEISGEIQGVDSYTYPVGLSRVGAVGVFYDDQGNLSEPVDLPLKREAEKFPGQAEYWPEDLPYTETKVDEQGTIDSITKCEGIRSGKSKLLKRDRISCGVLIAHLTSKKIKASALEISRKERAAN